MFSTMLPQAFSCSSLAFPCPWEVKGSITALCVGFEGNGIILMVVLGNVAETISEGFHLGVFLEQSGNAFTA